MAFFEHINYAASHEDGRSELRALRLGSGDRVLCITGSGSRVLDLLVDEPAEVVAVDFNPAQNRLLELKMAAMRALDYGRYAAFIGLSPCRDRADLYRAVRRELPAPARRSWDAQPRVLERGVLYCGRWERFLRVMVAPAALARRRLILRLFDCDSVAQQADIWLREWNTPGWERYLAVLASRLLWTRVVREPGMAHIPRELDIVQCIKGRFDRAAQSYLFRDSPWAWLVFRGRLRSEGPLPPHLQRAHFDTIAQRTRRVRCVDASLLAHLGAAPEASYDAFSVSDFGSYADEAHYRATWSAMARAAAPGARVCERQFLVPRDPVALCGVPLARDAALEAALRAEDTSVVYELIAGTLGPSAR